MQDLIATAKAILPAHILRNIAHYPIMLNTCSSASTPNSQAKGNQALTQGRQGDPEVDKDRQRGCKGAKNRGFWREEPGPSTHQQPLEGRVELPDFVGQPL